jgi:hypothetical protein
MEEIKKDLEAMLTEQAERAERTAASREELKEDLKKNMDRMLTERVQEAPVKDINYIDKIIAEYKQAQLGTTTDVLAARLLSEQEQTILPPHVRDGTPVQRADAVVSAVRGNLANLKRELKQARKEKKADIKRSIRTIEQVLRIDLRAQRNLREQAHREKVRQKRYSKEHPINPHYYSLGESVAKELPPLVIRKIRDAKQKVKAAQNPMSRHTAERQYQDALLNATDEATLERPVEDSVFGIIMAMENPDAKVGDKREDNLLEGHSSAQAGVFDYLQHKVDPRLPSDRTKILKDLIKEEKPKKHKISRAEKRRERAARKLKQKHGVDINELMGPFGGKKEAKSKPESKQRPREKGKK